jgi:hypothetical protein
VLGKVVDEVDDQVGGMIFPGLHVEIVFACRIPDAFDEFLDFKRAYRHVPAFLLIELLPFKHSMTRLSGLLSDRQPPLLEGIADDEKLGYLVELMRQVVYLVITCAAQPDATLEMLDRPDGTDLAAHVTETPDACMYSASSPHFPV